MVKFIKYIFIAVILFASCKPKYKEVITTIEMQKITGDWITATYKIPKNSVLYIRDYKGGYALHYQCRPLKWYHPILDGEIRSGVIDYKIKK